MPPVPPRHGGHIRIFFPILFFLVFHMLPVALQTAFAAEAGKPLRVVIDNNYPPYIFLDGEGRAQGILVDQWRLWEKQAGIPVKISVMDWESALRRMRNGEFDVIDTVFKTEERTTWLDFGSPHARIEVAVFFKNDISGITDIASLRGFVVAAKDGDAAVEALKKEGIENLVLFKGYEDIVRAAKEHKVNVFVIDKPPALYFLYKYGIEKLFKASIAMPSGEFHRAVGKGKETLLATVEEGFSRLSPKELERINQKWMGTPVASHITTGAFLVGLGCLLAMLLLFIFWNRSLRRAVQRRTAELESSRADLAHTTELLIETGRIARIGAWEKIPERGEERWSEITREIAGVDGEYVPTMIDSLEFYVESEEKERLAAAIENAEKSGAPFDIEARLRTGSGEVRWVRCLGRAEMVDGVCRRLYGTLQDIEQRKRTEKALIESEERFRLLVRNSSDSLVILNSDGSQRYVSPGAERMTGYPVEELEGRSIESIIHPDDFPGVMAAWNEAVAHPEKTVTVRYRHIHRTREWAYFEAIAQSFLGEPSINGVIASVRDISEGVAAEAEKDRLQQQLTQAQKMESVGRLAGGVAHDFNNMLSVILGHTELAQRTIDESHPLSAHLQEISRAATRSADLTRQLLAFARKQTVTPKVLDLNETVEGMLKMLRRLIGEDIELLWEPGQNLWPVRIDPSQVDQMLANLCINARDAIADTGRVTIRTSTASFDPDYCADRLDLTPGDYVLLSVTDSGSGMDENTLSHLFEPFFTTKDLGKGTGLGLATVYGIVKQNGGLVNVVSSPGQGATFTIYLPRHLVDPGQRRQRHEAAAVASGQGTILLVEDEPMILEVTRTMLKLQGYEVLVAPLPAEAVRLAEQYGDDIGLLMTDVVMPDMNGRELARLLQTQFPGLKCLFMSGYTADVIAQHGVLGSEVHFIQKPFTMEDLAVKVREVMGGPVT